MKPYRSADARFVGVFLVFADDDVSITEARFDERRRRTRGRMLAIPRLSDRYVQGFGSRPAARRNPGLSGKPSFALMIPNFPAQCLPDARIINLLADFVVSISSHAPFFQNMQRCVHNFGTMPSPCATVIGTFAIIFYNALLNFV